MGNKTYCEQISPQSSAHVVKRVSNYET